MICKRRNKRKHTTHPCRQNGLLSTLMNCKLLTWVFCTCFSLNAPFPENISLTLMSSISVLPVLRGDHEDSSLEGPTSQLCNLPRLFCISWCLGPNVLLASTFPLDFKGQLWLDGWASASSSSGNALVTWENFLSHFACRLSNITNKLLHSTLPIGGHMIQIRGDQQILLPVWELPASCPLGSPAG